MSYMPSETGAKVTLIKQKFESNCDLPPPKHDQKDLRRSLSASPIKLKKNLKLNVTRQLSNPSKNIKRTPAFRGDKHSRIKHLHSPSTDKPPSLVHKNVKIFEETPEYGKLGNVKKKSYFDTYRTFDNPDRKAKDRDKSKYPESTVRTTVISRQKNIYPLITEKPEEGKVSVCKDIDEVDCAVIPVEDLEDPPEIEKFSINGVEYTQVLKSNRPDVLPTSPRIGESLDIREDLPSRKSADLEATLKAALEAPLPAGPPPKKPPRTFAHSPLTQRSHPASPGPGKQPTSIFRSETESAFKNSLSSMSTSDDDFCFKDFLKNPDKLDDKLNDIKNWRNNSSSWVSARPAKSAKSSRDSKKMLEKLETVLIQHQKALGPKVIMPRLERSEMSIGFEAKNDKGNRLSRTMESDKDNRLSRTMESDKRIQKRKNSTFDCLPYLNCAGGTVYEQPTFKGYFGDLAIDTESKSEDSLSGSIENVLSSSGGYDEGLSPGSKRLSTELTTFLEGRRRTGRGEERVYAEPFAFDKNSGTDITGFGDLSRDEHNYLSRSWGKEGSREDGGRKQSAELHYLCTPINPKLLEDNNNAPEESNKLPKEQMSFQSFLENTNTSTRPSLNGPNRAKAEHLLNQAFGKFTMSATEPSTDSSTSSDTDSLASTLSLGEELTSFSDKLRLFKNRENTHKLSKEELHRTLTEKRKCYVRKVSIKYAENSEVSVRWKKDRLFDVCLLVELNLSTRIPYIKDKYPIYAEVPAWIENFCFPDAQDWPPDDSSQNQFHSLFLMDEKGNRRFGYCIRVQPEGGPVLPLAYCLITKHRASGFYHKVLQELESKHGLPDKNRRRFIEELYNSTMPKPGSSLRMTKEKPEILSNLLINNNGRDGDVNEDEVKDRAEYESLIMRSGDPRLEERDMSQLFDAVSNKVLIFLFGSLLLERKVVLLGGKLSKLSSCVEALQSLLYPFSWPHTFIPVLPDIDGLEEILAAPPPFVIGILKGKCGSNAQVGSIQDGIVVDLDTSKVICAVGDEGSILPKRLQEGIRSALQLVTNNTKHGDDIRNFLVSEAFLRVFVETCAHLEGHLVTQQDGKIIFQKESFVKACSSKTVQFFLEWFVETIMFNSFVTDYIASVEGTAVGEKYDIKLFKQRVAEYRKLSDKNLSKKAKKKTFGKFTFNF